MQISDPIALVLKNKSPDLWTTTPDSTVFAAIEKMAEKNVGALPVMDGGKLVGIVSERDYTRNVILKGKSSKETPVSSIMSTELVTIKPNDSVAESLQTMSANRVRHLPVLDGDNKMIGIVTIGDLVKWTISAQGALIGQLEGYIQGSYPG